MSDSSFKTVFKNIAPAVVVMVAGLLGAFMVYDSYFSDSASASYSQISPAAGEATDEAATTEDGASMMDQAAEGAEVVYDSASEAVQDMGEAVKEGAEDAVDAVEDGAEAVKEHGEEHMEEHTTEDKAAE